MHGLSFQKLTLVGPLGEGKRPKCHRRYVYSPRVCVYIRLCSARILRQEVARCALAWSQWECASENFLISEERIRSAGDDWAICRAKHECHYLAHGGFFSSRWPREDNALLDQIEKTIQHVPGTIVQSRYDMICPMKTAWDLHQRWKKAEFVVVPDAGHSPAHPNVQAAFLKAIDRFKDASL
eukprot:scpid55698/ scgid0773/ Proline iminopeptidase; Prolyl aminopeptidase